MGVAWQSLLFLALVILVELQGSVLRSSLEEDDVKRPRTNELMQPLSIFKRDTRDSEDDQSNPVVLSGFGFNKSYLERMRRFAKCGTIPKEPEHQKEAEDEKEDGNQDDNGEIGLHSVSNTGGLANVKRSGCDSGEKKILVEGMPECQVVED